MIDEKEMMLSHPQNFEEELKRLGIWVRRAVKLKEIQDPKAHCLYNRLKKRINRMHYKFD